MSYRISVFYDGLPVRVRDRQITKAVYGDKERASFEGSGFGFGERDLSYIVPSKIMANAAVRRLKAVKDVRVELTEVNG